MPKKTVQTKKTTKNTKAAKTSLTVDIFDMQGKATGQMALSTDVFGQKTNNAILAQAVRVHQINRRQGTQSTKTRSWVSGSTHKIYRQKGTGRARHGDRKAPIFVGGGVAHGPHPREFVAKLSKTMRKKALFSALSTRLHEGKIKVIDNLETIKGKTREIVALLTVLNLNNAKKTGYSLLLVLPAPMESVERAVSNISGVSIRYAALLNTYDVLRFENIVFLKNALSVVTETFLNEVPKSSPVKEEKIKSATSATTSPEKKATTKKPTLKKTTITKKKTISRKA